MGLLTNLFDVFAKFIILGTDSDFTKCFLGEFRDLKRASLAVAYATEFMFDG